MSHFYFYFCLSKRHTLDNKANLVLFNGAQWISFKVDAGVGKKLLDDTFEVLL